MRSPAPSANALAVERKRRVRRLPRLPRSSLTSEVVVKGAANTADARAVAEATLAKLPIRNPLRNAHANKAWALRDPRADSRAVAYTTADGRRKTVGKETIARSRVSPNARMTHTPQPPGEITPERRRRAAGGD